MLCGRQDVFVLDGGWTEWTRRQLPTSRGRYEQFYRPSEERGDWVARYRPGHFRDLPTMSADIRTAHRQVHRKRLRYITRITAVMVATVLVAPAALIDQSIHRMHHGGAIAHPDLIHGFSGPTSSHPKRISVGSSVL